MKPKYSGFAGEQHNMMADILAKFAEVDPMKLHEDATKAKFYKAMEETPFATMVCFLVDAMEDLGVTISDAS